LVTVRVTVGIFGDVLEEGRANERDTRMAVVRVKSIVKDVQVMRFKRKRWKVINARFK